MSSLGIFAGLGAGIDLATAYSARQRLSQVANLACQYSTRPSVGQTGAANYSGTNGFQNYVNSVNAFATASLATQHWNGPTPTGAGGATGSYFSATPAADNSPGSAAAAVPTNPVVEMSARIPTAFGKILNITSIPVHARIACQTLAYTPQIVNPPTLLQEGFEKPCTGPYGFCVFNPSGGTTEISVPANTFPAAPAYTGFSGFKWYVVGYCLETDKVGIINPTVPEGTYAAELDCGNGSNSAGNSSISTKLYLEPGQYELRYNYRSRVRYIYYDPVYICGSTAGDVSWANGVGPWVSGPRTNQINVYLDANIEGTNGTTGSAPLHRTIDGTQYLAGSNLIDMCVYSFSWIERSVRIKVTTPGYYWLSFAADGINDSYGGQLDNIRLCQATCAGSLQDNFPTSWLASSNGGSNKMLFEDTFEAPVYTQDPFVSSAHAKGGNLASSTGTSIASSGCDWYSYPAPPGWPCQQQSGWATAPYNEVMYWMQGASQGNQFVTLQGWNGFSNSSDPINRIISRPFLLDPGYYNVSYLYTSMVTFDFVYGVYCAAAPNFRFAYDTGGLRYGYPYPGGSGSGRSQYMSTDFLGVFMSNGSLISTPNTNSTLGGAPTYNNPDGTVTSSPKVPPDTGSLYTAYDPASVAPMIDFCWYSSGYAWTPRSINVKITKPGWYWLTFSAQGDTLTTAGAGPAIDDVKLTALGSLYNAAPSAPVVYIPVADPQPDTSYAAGTYPGFTIVANPLTPPGADQ